jgi:hypothetical protein
MALTPLHSLAAVIPALRTAALRGLERLTSDADRPWRGLTSCGHARLCASRRAPRAPGAVVTPLGKGVIDGALGESIRGQPIPWTPTLMTRSSRVEDCPPIALAWASSSLAGLGRREQRCHTGPVRVRQSRWRMLARRVFFEHCCARLRSGDMRELSKNSPVLPSSISG